MFRADGLRQEVFPYRGSQHPIDPRSPRLVTVGIQRLPAGQAFATIRLVPPCRAGVTATCNLAVTARLKQRRRRDQVPLALPPGAGLAVSTGRPPVPTRVTLRDGSYLLSRRSVRG